LSSRADDAETDWPEIGRAAECFSAALLAVLVFPWLGWLEVTKEATELLE